MVHNAWIYVSVVAWMTYKILEFLVRRRFRATLTAMEDVPLLGLPRKEGRKIHGTAVICGGSVAGLLSARVCSDHFENVIIVEPEAWVATEEGLRDRHRETFIPGSTAPKRSRVTQTTSMHVFQVFTIVALRKLFPNFDREAERVGARIVAADGAQHISGTPILAPYDKYPDGLPAALNMTRSAYESTLRRLVLSHCPNVKYVTGSVTGLVPHPSKNTITSVKVRTSGVDDSSTELSAALVVDCTGPTLGGLRWLQNVTFKGQSPNTDKGALPLERLKTTYDPKMAYTTCEYNMPPALHQKMKALVYPLNYEKSVLYTWFPKPEQDSTMVSFQRRDGGYLQVLCGGWDYRDKINSVADLRDCISSFVTEHPVSDFVYTLLDMLEEQNVPATYVHARIPPQVYVRYSRAAQLPSNFVALGDSVLQLNPIRGQGCTKACIEAVTLNAILTRSPLELPEDFSRTYFSMQAKRSGGSWDALKYSDYALRSTVPEAGETIKAGAFRRWYGAKFTELTTKDREAASDFWHVWHFLAPPTDMFSLRALVKIAWMQIADAFSL